MNLTTVVWSLPIIFMLHDFEEIIMVNAWQVRNANKLERITKGAFTHWKSPDSGAAAVLIEFILLTLAALVTCLFQLYQLWLVLAFIFNAHLLAHYLFGVMFRGYVPGLTTAVVLAPLSVYTFLYVWNSDSYQLIQVIPIFALSLPVFGLFFFFLTKSIALFFKLLKTYADGK